MITPYRGRVDIKCTVDICNEDRSISNVKLSCHQCALHTTEVLSLEEKPIAEIKKETATIKSYGKAISKSAENKIASTEV